MKLPRAALTVLLLAGLLQGPALGSVWRHCPRAHGRLACLLCLACKQQLSVWQVDLVKIFATLVDPKGNILIPGINDSVAPVTAEEEKVWDWGLTGPDKA